MSQFSTKPSGRLIPLLVAAACLFFLGLGRLPLLEPDEGRNAEVAREMLAAGDWITPHYDALPYLDKPAVFFWMVAGSFRLFGISEWAARFPSALMGLLTVVLVWLLARRMFGEGDGWRAGIIFATSPLVIAFGRTVIFDMTLAFLMTLAMLCFWLAESVGFSRPWLDPVMFGAIGLASITKGPVGFLLPLLSILAYEALRGRLRELKRLRWGLGLAVFFAVALPWFIAVSIRNPAFPRYAFWQESLLRFTSHRAHRSGSVFYYVPVYLAGFLPWSFFLLFAAWNQRRVWKEIRRDEHKAAVFLLAWALVIFVFFSISRSKLPAYLLPAVVPLSVAMARVWSDVRTAAERGSRPPDWLTAGFAALTLLGLLTAATPEWVRFSSLEKLAAKKIHPAVLPMIGPSMFYTGLALLALGILGRHVAARYGGTTMPVATFAILVLTIPLLLLRWWAPLRTYAATASSRDLAVSILRSPERDLPLYGYYYFRTGLPFYLRRPVGLVTTEGDEMTSNYVVLQFMNLRDKVFAGRRLLISARDFQSLARTSSGPLLVLARNNAVAQLSQTVGSIDPLWDSWEYSVWKVPPGSSPEDAGQSPVLIEGLAR